MPTARPRHMIAETDDIAAALDAAARRDSIRAGAGSLPGLWPETWRDELRSERPE